MDTGWGYGVERIGYGVGGDRGTGDRGTGGCLAGEG